MSNLGLGTFCNLPVKESFIYSGAKGRCSSCRNKAQTRLSGSQETTSVKYLHETVKWKEVRWMDHDSSIGLGFFPGDQEWV